MPRAISWPRALALLGTLVLQRSTAAGAPPPQCPALTEKADALSVLRAGGLVIVMRHATAITNEATPCQGNQHPLTREGEAEAKAIGSDIRRLQIPVAQVRYSRTCRTAETAKLIFPEQARTEDVRLEMGHDSSAINKAIREGPSGSGNTFLITHGTVMNWIEIQGQQAVKAYGQGKSVYAAVFDPRKGDSPLLGCLRAGDWKSIQSASGNLGPRRKPDSVP